MNKSITVEDAVRIQNENADVARRIGRVCATLERCLPKCKDRLVEILGKNAVWILGHGVVHPDEDWSIVDADTTPKVKVGAWDGYDGELFRNSSMEFPFAWLNMDADALESLISG